MIDLEEFLCLANIRQAFYKVADNGGGPGVDGETIEMFAENEELNLRELRDSLANSSYQPQPLKQVKIPKKQGEWRELRIPTLRDRIVQQALLNVLYPITETLFSNDSFAYRPNRHYTDAVKRVAYWRDQGYLYVFDGDIVKFFDNLDHHRLLVEVRKVIDNLGVLCLIKGWITAGVVTKTGIIYPEKGVPQGAVISPLLANIYLHEFDIFFQESDLKLVRYADDFLLLSDTKDGIMSAYSSVRQLLNYMGLQIHEQKSQITHFHKGFQFLGHGFFRNSIIPIDDDSKSSNNKGKKKAPFRRQKRFQLSHRKKRRR
ncbi:MAG: reverse transcriptase domain-containing protein [Crocosphaera sp.]